MFSAFRLRKQLPHRKLIALAIALVAAAGVLGARQITASAEGREARPIEIAEPRGEAEERRENTARDEARVRDDGGKGGDDWKAGRENIPDVVEPTEKPRQDEGAEPEKRNPRDYSAIDFADVDHEISTCHANGRVEVVEPYGEGFLVGGEFTVLSGKGEGVGGPYLAYCSAEGAASAFGPELNNTVYDIDLGCAGVVVGGRFTAAGDQTRRRVAVLESNGDLADWDVWFNGTVRATVVDGSTMLIGGGFSHVDAFEQPKLARVGCGGAIDTAFQPEITDPVWAHVRAIHPEGGAVYVGGKYSHAGGEARNSIAAVDAVEGGVLPFAPDIDDPNTWGVLVERIQSSGDQIYVCGDFWTVNGLGSGTLQRNVGRFDPVTGEADDDWSVWTDGGIQDCYLDTANEVIYVGGHFEYVNDRFQRKLAAADLSTGLTVQAFQPNPNSQWGVWGLAMHPELGLLVGGDFTKYDGHDVGRLAISEVGPIVAADPIALLDTVITEPAFEDVENTHDITAEGWFVAPNGIDRVTLALQLGPDEWLQPDGTVGPWYQFEADLDTDDFLTGTWSLDLSIPNGNWAMIARARDVAGGSDTTPAMSHFTVDAELEDLDTSIDDPADGAAVGLDPFTMSGAAAAPSGVEAVRITARHDSSGQWLQPDGSLGDWTPLWAIVFNPGSITSNWHKELTLTAGEWTIWARTEGVNGEIDTSKAEITITVGSSAAPESTIDEPQHKDILTGSPIAISGTATDDTGIDSVRLTIRHEPTGLWLRTDGTLGAWQIHPTTLANPGATSTGWSVDVDAPGGTYTIWSKAVDVDGVEQDPKDEVFIYLDLEDPTIVVDTPQPGAEVNAGTLTITGEAEDDAQVRKIRLRLRNADTGDYLRYDGVWVPTWSWFEPSTITGLYTTEATFSDDVNIAPGNYELKAYVVDRVDNTVSTSTIAFTVS